MSIFDMYIPCEASSWTLLHQNRKLSSRISLQNRLFCLCRLPAVFELIDKYRFDRQSIMMICDMLQDDLESSTFRNRAYFFFMFYLHDISIQSLKLVSYITVERKILQIDEGSASKLKSGKLRNIMIVSLLNIHVPKF